MGLPGQDDVNRSAQGRVEVLGLKVVPKTEIDALKSVVRSTRLCARGRRFALKTRRGVQEESKRKKYRCVCWVLGKGADAR